MKMRIGPEPILALAFLVLLGACDTPGAPSPADEAAPRAPAHLGTDSEPLERLAGVLESEGYRLATEHASTVSDDGVNVTTVPIDGTASSLTYVVEDDAIATVQYSAFASDGEILTEWPVCHVPEDRPSNLRTIHVGYEGLQAHVGRHGGDTLGPCPNDAASGSGIDLTTVVLADGVLPIVTKATFDAGGEVVVLDVGEAAGTGSLADLTTVGPPEPPEPPDTTMADFAAFLEETLGEDARPVLEAIPESMGGRGAELDVVENGATP